jgi:hypothetical protein
MSKRSGTADAVASIGTLLGNAIAKAKRSTAPTKKKKKTTKKTSSTIPAGTLSTQESRQLVKAPASMGYRSLFRTTNSFSIPFNSALFVYWNTTRLYINASGALSGGSTSFNFNPISGYLGDTPSLKPFGPAIYNIAQGFAKFCIPKLKVTYEGVVNTSSSGNVGIGLITDPYAPYAPTSYSQAISAPKAISTPVWSSGTSMDLSEYGKEWKFVVPSSNSSAPDERTTALYSLTPTSVGYTNASSIVVGILHLSGVICFKDLFDNADLGFRTTEPSSEVTSLSPYETVQCSSSSSNLCPPPHAPSINTNLPRTAQRA